MPEDVLQPSIIRVSNRRGTKLPAHILSETLSAPIGDIERGVSKDKIEFFISPLVLMERALVIPGDAARVDPTHGEVHLTETPSCVVALLTIDGKLADPPAVRF